MGGNARVRCRGDVASVEWASPKPGFVAELEDSGPHQVDVRFESESHESRLRVECRDGEHDPRIEERASD